jgi:hypothetical protein
MIKFIRMKTFLLLLSIVAILATCSDEDSPRKMKVTVPITLLDVDNIGIANEELSMRVKAIAPSGCYSDLEIALEKIDERHHILTASATYFSKNNICPYNIVSRDTIISFTPQVTGVYYFSANKPDLTILRDTLIVE